MAGGAANEDSRASRDGKARLESALRRAIELRAQLARDHELGPRVRAVKQWQAQRLRTTYADLLQSPRYRPACEFFLDELYGTRDFMQRDTEALRVVPMLARLLPERAVVTLALGSELDELSETLDARVAGHLPASLGEGGQAPLEVSAYAAAYRAAGTLPERRRQIEHIVQIGLLLDKLARLPLISGMLHLMRGPADAAGLSHLHQFLARGFDSFRSMRGAVEFVDIVRERETALMEQLFEEGA